MHVSVIIPSFNRVDYLERTIQSVVNQTYKKFDIIVVDDCSQDNTFDVVQALQKKWEEIPIRYIKHEVNKGESGSRNTGIQAATGDYVAFLDSDDAWAEEKLTEQINFLTKNNLSYDGVVSEYYSIVDETTPKEIITFPNATVNAESVLIKGTGFSIGTTLVLKRNKINEMFDEKLKLFADLDWMYRTLLHCTIGVVHKPLAYYYKSPMRKGDYIKEHAKIFIKKYEPILNKVSLFKKSYFFSTIHWYLGLAYDAHHEYGKAIQHYIKGFAFMPFRRLGNYVHVLKLFFLWIAGKK